MVKKRKKIVNQYHGNQWGKTVLVLSIVSLLFHLLTIEAVDSYRIDFDRQYKNSAPVKIMVKERPKKLIETTREETEPPEDSEYAGAVDRKTAQQSRVVKPSSGEKAGDNGDGMGKGKPARGEAKTFKPRKSALDKFLPKTGELKGGLIGKYQDLVTDKTIPIGEVVDINTTSYRWMGYFVGVRRTFMLASSPPIRAMRQGMRGTVTLFVTIYKTGEMVRLDLIKSSGYAVLDDNAITSFRNAAPFQPLPKGREEDYLSFTANIIY